MDEDTFKGWKALVDAECVRQCGMSTDDIPDYDYYRQWREGCAPAICAKKAIKAAQ